MWVQEHLLRRACPWLLASQLLFRVKEEKMAAHAGTHAELVAENIARGVKELEKKDYESSK